MSRLAGAGGAAESALMNEQSNAQWSGWLCGKFVRSHNSSLQAKIGAIKTDSFFLNYPFYLGNRLKTVIVDICYFVTLAPLQWRL